MVSMQVHFLVLVYIHESSVYFRKFPSSHARINRGIGLGLEVPVEYIFTGDKRAIDWVVKRISALEKELDKRVNRCTLGAS